MRTPTLVGQEGTLQVGSLLPISLGPISDRCILNIRIYIRNSRISIRVVIAQLCCSLLGWCSMFKELLNDISTDTYLVPASKTLFIISENYRKKSKIVKKFCNLSFYIRLTFIINRLGLGTGINRSSPIKALGSTSQVVTQHNL